MNRTYDAKAFERACRRAHSMKLVTQRWTSIFVWTGLSAVVAFCALASAFPENSVLCTLTVGLVPLALHLFVRPWYERRAQRRVNVEHPPPELDA